MTTQPDLQARYLVSILDLLADEAGSNAGTPRIRSLANSAVHLARQLTDTLDNGAPYPLPIALGGNVIPFRKA
jgi:hypothetical protein